MRRHIAILFVGFALSGAFAMSQELVVDEAVICKAVVDRTPQEEGDTFAIDVGRLYCFSMISGGTEGSRIRHVWKMGENEMAVVELDIGGSPWRTWSSKTFDPTWTGAWTVEIQDADGTVLHALSFTLE